MNTRFAVRVFCVLAIVSWQVGGAHAQATPTERPPPSIQEEEQEQPAEGEAPPSDDQAQDSTGATAEPDVSNTPEDETWARRGATKQDANFEASATETLARDPRNYFAGEAFHPGWVRVPGVPIEVRFGGFIELNLVHDFQATGIPTGEFIPSLLPVPTDFTPNTNFDVQSTRFIFESRTKAKTTWVSVFLSMDFAGDLTSSTPSPRLRQAYFTFSGLLLGRAYGTFFDAQTWPDIFDLEGPNAMTATRTEMVRYSYGIVKSGEQQVPDKVIVTAAIENPETSVTNGDNLKAWPGVVARLDLNYGWGHMAFMGMGRQLIAESTAGGGKDSQYSGSGAVSFKLNIPGSQAKSASAPSDDVVGQVTYGTAGGNYIQDLEAVPPQNPVDRTIVDVSALGVELGYPNASLAVRPARNRRIEPEAAARARAREPRLATTAGHSAPQEQTSQADEG